MGYNVSSLILSLWVADVEVAMCGRWQFRRNKRGVRAHRRSRATCIGVPVLCSGVWLLLTADMVGT